MRVTAKQEINGYGAMGQERLTGEIVITLTIPTPIWNEAKAHGWHYKEIFIAGMESKRGMPNIMTRMKELEDGNAKLSRAYAHLWDETHQVKK